MAAFSSFSVQTCFFIIIGWCTVWAVSFQTVLKGILKPESVPDGDGRMTLCTGRQSSAGLTGDGQSFTLSFIRPQSLVLTTTPLCEDKYFITPNCFVSREIDSSYYLQKAARQRYSGSSSPRTFPWPLHPQHNRSLGHKKTHSQLLFKNVSLHQAVAHCWKRPILQSFSFKHKTTWQWPLITFPDMLCFVVFLSE